MSTETQSQMVHPRRGELGQKLGIACVLTEEIHNVLEDLEQAVDEERPHDVQKAFSAALRKQDELRQMIDTDIAFILDEIAPHADSIPESHSSVKRQLGHIAAGLNVLSKSVQFETPKRGGIEFDSATLQHHLEFIGEIEEQAWLAEEAVEKDPSKALNIIADVSQQLSVLGITFDYDYNASEADQCEHLHEVAERAFSRLWSSIREDKEGADAPEEQK